MENWRWGGVCHVFSTFSVFILPISGLRASHDVWLKGASKTKTVVFWIQLPISQDGNSHTLFLWYPSSQERMLRQTFNAKRWRKCEHRQTVVCRFCWIWQKYYFSEVELWSSGGVFGVSEDTRHGCQGLAGLPGKLRKVRTTVKWQRRKCDEGGRQVAAGESKIVSTSRCSVTKGWSKARTAAKW